MNIPKIAPLFVVYKTTPGQFLTLLFNQKVKLLIYFNIIMIYSVGVWECCNNNNLLYRYAYVLQVRLKPLL